MKFHTLEHCAGYKYVPPSIKSEISSAIESIYAKPQVGAAPSIRKEFLQTLKTLGWSAELAVSIDSDITITSAKLEVGLCLQTGNMARMYADLIKLQTLYLNNAIGAAAIVIPSEPLAKVLGSNIAQSKRLERELDIFKKAYSVPTIIFALE